MVVGLIGISLMSPHVCVYDSITNSSLEFVVMEQLQLDNVNLCSKEFVSTITTCVQPTYQCSSSLHP
jgi:hypothetical protein